MIDDISMLNETVLNMNATKELEEFRWKQDERFFLGEVDINDLNEEWN